MAGQIFSHRNKPITVKIKRQEPLWNCKLWFIPLKKAGFGRKSLLLGCVSEGDTFEETLLNIKEAAEGWLEVTSMRIKNTSQTQIAEIELWNSFQAKFFDKTENSF